MLLGMTSIYARLSLFLVSDFIVASSSADRSASNCTVDCLINCTKGQYYTSGHCRECPPGFYCLGRGADPRGCRPDTGIDSAEKDNVAECQDASPKPCPNGTYSSRHGLASVSQCDLCPVGKYCFSEGPKPPAITWPTGRCPGGHYCPLGTGSPDSFPCKPGFYLNTSGAETEASCSLCPSGFYCNDHGSKKPSVCPRGFYCVSGSVNPHSCGLGTYSSRDGLQTASECLPCGGGQYCADVALTKPTGYCKAGFYCRESATTATPSDGMTGGICPPGGYCPLGSAFPEPCPAGSFSNASGLRSSKHCVPCSAGCYCAGLSNRAVTGRCMAGYFCTGGASSPDQRGVREGHYSLAGAAKPEPCPLGTYQSARLQSSCQECLPGRFCNQTGLDNPLPCLEGHYCVSGSILPVPCPAGYYLDQTGAEVISSCKLCDIGMYCGRGGLAVPEGPCQAGYYCTGGSNTSLPSGMSFGDICPAGYYCPPRSRHAYEHPCPTGTWNNLTGAQNSASCLPCTPGLVCNGVGLREPNGLCASGFYCTMGAKSPTPLDGVTGNLCPENHYCPEAAAVPLQCGDGSYTNIQGQGRCFDCPPGFYCVKGHGLRLCPPGHYCLRNTGQNHLHCPPGTYNPVAGLTGLEQCLQCPHGKFCGEWGLKAPSGSCEQGYFCLTGVNIGTPDGNVSVGIGGPCPRGHYCPPATAVPLPCPVGTYSERPGLGIATNCTACRAGMYCGSVGLVRPSGDCDPGFYCFSSATTPTPWGVGDVGGVCPVSHFCPTGTAQPIPCPAGTYNNLSRQASCATCAAGYYCPQNSTTFLAYPCLPGFYCPNGTKHATEFPCPRGYYNPEPMTQSVDSCLPCPPGHYCGKEKLTTLSGKCKAGWFCVSAAWTSQPFDLDNYTNANCLCPATATGGKCQPGYYCPEGSIAPVSCPPGAYCNDSGLTLPSGKCNAGYYCIVEATHPQPTDGLTGNTCPRGSYCGPGSAKPTPCPTGTFSNAQGLSDVSECLLCTAGFYCEIPGLTTPTGVCSQGYYCPPGYSVSEAVECPLGHYCPEASHSPLLCESGSWQDLMGQTGCKSCEAGHYCDNSNGPVVDLKLFWCPEGYYCPVGTRFPAQYGCSPGTFSPNVRLQNSSGCQPCLPGMYCASIGLKAPSGNCSSGYWCKQGAVIDTPVDGKSGSACPAGNYCPSGSALPIPCPSGTWRDRKGGETEADCRPCPGGLFCDRDGLTSPSGSCAPGYFCVGGAASPKPTDVRAGGPCSAGHYCPRGTGDPIPCAPGTYTTATHATECLVCPGGRFCIAGLDPQPCPAGFYCPEGSSYSWQPCPIGTYSPAGGLAHISECRPCDGGKYCVFQNATEATGECRERFYCAQGSDSPTPEFDARGKAGPCPVGHYCPFGTSTPLPCPAGTFSNVTKLASQDDCAPCNSGHYCGSEGLAEPSGECWEGFYCSGRAKVPNNPFRDHTGGPCYSGHFCPRGTSFPIGCPAGSYSDLEAASRCTPCVEGYFCPSNSSSYESNVCVPGYYCPQGTASTYQFPCPKGTYGSRAGSSNILDCVPCDPGHYCDRAALITPAGLCEEGFYCLTGSNSSRPTQVTLGAGPCPPGCYCAGGNSSPKPCPAGTYNPVWKQAKCLVCPQGYYCDDETGCLSGSDCVRQQADSGKTAFPHGAEKPRLCPAGSFCPLGTAGASQYPCPPGSYSNTTKLARESDCRHCPPGWFCRDFAQVKPSGKCSPGYYCILRAKSPRPQGNSTGGMCPPGFYCPKGSEIPKACPANTIRLRSGAQQEEDCQPCPPGYWCKEGDPVLHLCPPGHYCDGITQVPFKFPSGPHLCPEQTYLTERGAANLGHCQACPPGYYCNRTGLTAYEHYLCPVGYWCPGNGLPIPCAGGTMRSQLGGASINDCQPCRPGHYCPEPKETGQTNINGVPCRAGFECPEGSLDELVCRAGSYCGHRTGVPPTCPGGYFCPFGSHTYNTPEQLCVFPYFCPGNSSQMWSCDGGYRPVNVTGLRDGLHRSCLICEAGTFRKSTATELHCVPCPSGFRCPQGTENYSANPCPGGYYCPEMTHMPTPCPPGSYGNTSHAKRHSECYPCPINTFNHLYAQEACFPCGSTSYASAGSSTCACRGLNRAFQESDGSCICETRYVYYNEANQKSSDGNSDADCEPEVEDRCGSSHVRLASNRRCVDAKLYDCSPLCGQTGGKLSVEFGICHCNKYISAEEQCNVSCRSRALNISAKVGVAGQLTLIIQSGIPEERRRRVIADVLGPERHITASPRVLFTQFEVAGVFGLILTFDIFLTEYGFAYEPENSAFSSRSQSQVGSLPTTIDRSLLKIPNPVTCLEPNDMIIFQLSVNSSNRNSSHYPVYQKDHLFNTNPRWDFGSFRKLDYFIRETNLNITRFAHVFAEPGKYVFADNAEPDRTVIVSVAALGCDPGLSLFQPSSPTQLQRHGILKWRKLNLAPDWTTISGILYLISLVTALFTVAILVLKPVQAKLNPLKAWKPKWRSLGEAYIPPEYMIVTDSLEFYETFGLQGSAGRVEDREKCAITTGKTLGFLEDFSVRTLYDKLEDQNLHLASQLAKHRSDVQMFHRHISQQTQELKEMIRCLSPCPEGEVEGKWIRAEGSKANTRTKADVPSSTQRNGVNNSGVANRLPRQKCPRLGLEEIIRTLEVLVDKFNRRQVTVVKDLMEKGQRSPSSLSPTSQDVTATEYWKGASLPQQVHCAVRLRSDVEVISDSFENSQERATLPAMVGSRAVEGDEGSTLALTDLIRLSPHHFVVYRFGDHIVRWLWSRCGYPRVTLLLADRLPGETALPCQDTSYNRDFYYDSDNRIVYVESQWLERIGGFIMIVLHALTHIKAGFQLRDDHPVFTEEFHCVIAAVYSALFTLCCEHPDHTTAKRRGHETKGLTSRGETSLAPSVFEDLISVRVPPDTKFAEEILQERLKRYRRFMLEGDPTPTGLNSTKPTKATAYPWIDRVSKESEEKAEDLATSDQIRFAEIEHEVDGLNEQYSVYTTRIAEYSLGVQQIQQELRRQDDLAQEPGDKGAESSSRLLREFSKGKDALSMLSLQRLCVMSRLAELEPELLHFRKTPNLID